MVFQSYALFPHMSVLENVALRPRGGSGWPKDEVASARDGRSGDGRPDRLRRAPAVRAVRRPAAARRRRARAGARAVGAAVRRAAVESRRAPAPPDARGDPRPAAAAVAHRRLRHARPGRGDGGVGPHHRDEQAAIAQEGAPRELYEQPRDAVRRRLHGRRQSRARHPGAAGRRARRALDRAAEAQAAAPRAARGEVDVAIRPEAIELAPPANPVSPARCARPRTSAG